MADIRHSIKNISKNAAMKINDVPNRNKILAATHNRNNPKSPAPESVCSPVQFLTAVNRKPVMTARLYP